MKTLIVYYSLEGNTDYAAKKIAENIGADTLRLIPRKAYKDKGFSKFIWGGKSAIMGEAPKLEDYEIDLSQYDKVVIGFPVWASNYTPPIRTFVNEHCDELVEKSIAAFACQSGTGAEKALAKLKETIGIDAFEAETIFIDPKARQTEETDEAIDTFSEKVK